MRKTFKFTPEQKARMMEAMKPVPLMYLSGGQPMQSQQENANNAWRALGSELGFDWMTARPSSLGDDYFTAEVKD